MGLHFSIRMAEQHTWKTTVASPCDALRPTKSHVQRSTTHEELSGVLMASSSFVACDRRAACFLCCDVMPMVLQSSGLRIFASDSRVPRSLGHTFLPTGTR